MGVGHVPARAIRQASEGDDVSRRQHRRAGTDHGHLSGSGRRALGSLGESIALHVLSDHGARLIARNVAVGRGEIDLHVAFGATVVAVEVKTLQIAEPAGVDALRSYTVEKADQVHRLARHLRPRPDRIDVVAVVIHRNGVDVRWVRAA